MKDFQVKFVYVNGNLIETIGWPVSGGIDLSDVPIVSVLSGVQMAISHKATEHKINGSITVSYSNEVLTARYDITPPLAKIQINQELARTYNVEQNSND